MSDVVVIAIVQPLPGRMDEVLSIIGENVPTVHEEDGCLTYAVQKFTDPDKIVFVERWTTREALAAHASAAHMAATNARLDGMMAAPGEVLVGESAVFGDAVKGTF
jgi:quinol monooxygenase YgiN